ncbi:alkylphosphonate utilization protein [Candidatus Gracilibacteria bacterium]|nr:alkylphosphonate utilization protein [Candidatus Gracilibacteria bacterium]
MEEVVETRDSNGVILQEGDSVQLIKDLDVKGSSINLKRGKVVKKIRLIGDTENVEFKEGKTTMVLKTCYVKKV